MVGPNPRLRPTLLRQGYGAQALTKPAPLSRKPLGVVNLVCLAYCLLPEPVVSMCL